MVDVVEAICFSVIITQCVKISASAMLGMSSLYVTIGWGFIDYGSCVKYGLLTAQNGPKYLQATFA